ncbi:broad-complex core protein isoforms 1/2/3/4/5 isoform X1 [Schistocerca piceifrons]|uniref:broad-complex core protein isoforms 1/2/3/4/5 isoform X1 n=1 Tax=Schistocerca piceifrons TaxID=274613 RepID=UPI001F5F121C|nr:broad-complex core protein isoforms 1/2/3/4/5 isoform X1 [Schistocerca piceifrons]XP_047110390.1 broad-complex core protein isoforms 1/2/3/4/5 isoform X1 [Schistocerca piceifrons]XP_047110392.1 broad-complex core protein isoforms 1/2/3/4/5 isoform X1 [Schistocerca piceifrons]
MMAETQHFCLRWNNYQSSITSAFENLRDDEDFVDVTLACDGKSLKAHRVVLSACSPYFRELLKSTPCKHPVIVLQDVAFADLHALVEFIYHGEVNVHQRNLSSFLKTAEVLRVSGLTQQADEREEVPVPPHSSFPRNALHHSLMDDTFFTSPHSPPVHSTPTGVPVNQLLRRAAMAGGGGAITGFGRRERRMSPDHQHHNLQDPSADQSQIPITNKRARTSEPTTETAPCPSQQQQPSPADFSTSNFPSGKQSHQGNIKMEAEGNGGGERETSPSPNGRNVMDGVKSEPAEHCGTGGDVENSTDSVEQADETRQQQTKGEQDDHDSVQGQPPSYLSAAESKLFGSITSAGSFNFSMAALAADPITGIGGQPLQGNTETPPGTSSQAVLPVGFEALQEMDGVLLHECNTAKLSLEARSAQSSTSDFSHCGVRYHCSQCEKSFTRSWSLQRHIDDVHSQCHTRTFVCNICSRQYSTRSSLISHRSQAHKTSVTQNSVNMTSILRTVM